MMDNNERKKAYRKYVKGKMTFMKWFNTKRKESYFFNDIKNRTVETSRSPNSQREHPESDYQFISGNKRILGSDSNEPKRVLLGILIALNHGIQSGVNNFTGVKSAANDAFRHYIGTSCNNTSASSSLGFEMGRVHVSSRYPFSIIPVLEASKGDDCGQQNEEQGSPRYQGGNLSVSLPRNVVCSLDVSKVTSQEPDGEIDETDDWEDFFDSKGAIVVKEATSTSSTLYIFQLVPINAEFSSSQSQENFLSSILNAFDDSPLVVSAPTVMTSDGTLPSYRPISVQTVPGLYVVCDFITMEEEHIIIAELEKIEREKEDQRKRITRDMNGEDLDSNDGSLGTKRDRVPELATWEIMARRDCWHFNRRFYYESNSVGAQDEEVCPENPEFFNWLMERMRCGSSSDGSSLWPVPSDYLCDQLTINRYRYDTDSTDGEVKEGYRRAVSGIAHHVDSHKAFGEVIFSLSLLSHTVMEFQRTEWNSDTLACFDRSSETNSSGHRRSVSSVPQQRMAVQGMGCEIRVRSENVFLPPRSLLIMTGEARYKWTHSISEKTQDFIADDRDAMIRRTRISLTCRKAESSSGQGIEERRHTKSKCLYPDMCDA
eukprot:Tbor_TRINITY_DN4986_c0_g1::TRINITY_DN4986_c0_g1_i1::g.9688::m.9688/K10770/ALKBH8; alkylated DNA repair protein alkB homolog 8